MKNDIIQIRNEFVPENSQKNVTCKWSTKTVKKCRRAKIRAWNKFIQCGKNSLLHDKYKMKLKTSVKVNRDAKKQFEIKLANNVKNDNKSFFAFLHFFNVRSKEKNKVKVGPLKDSTGSIITDNKITADIFNYYFASVFTTEDTNNIPIPDQIFTGHELDSLSKICLNGNIVYKKLN